MPDPQEPTRRSSDLFRDIHSRLDSQDDVLSEQNIVSRKLDTEIRELNFKVETVKLQMSHGTELLAERFRTLETTQALHGVRQEQVLTALAEVQKSISAMGADANNTPAGRQMVATVEAITENLTSRISTNEESIKSLIIWKERAEAIRVFLIWLSTSGAAALIWNILKSVGYFK